MPTQNELNDPEYRWQHKEEMRKIMPYTSERIRLKMKVIDYAQLRRDYLSKIKEIKQHKLDWNRFRNLIDSVPSSAYTSAPKHGLQPIDKYHFERRDKCTCYLCGTMSRYTQFHHVIPIGDTSDANIVTLCLSCHKMVHIALYTTGKRKGWM